MKWQLGVGFFIELEKCAGESLHCFHAKVLDPSSISFPARLLTIEQVQNTLDVVNATSNNGAGRNYLRLSIDKLVSLVKIAYLTQKANVKYQSKDNGIEHMISNFKDSNEISFSLMCQYKNTLKEKSMKLWNRLNTCLWMTILQ